MGRFETAAEFYLHREPYPAAFFETLARRLALAGRERLLDVGCGPAPLAIGFAPYVGEVVGVDPEDSMLEVARAEVAKAKAPVRLVKARIEDFESASRFDLVTIGRALHWLDRDRARARLEALAAPGARVVVAGAPSAEDSNPWLLAYRATWLSFATEPMERYRIDSRDWFAGSRFRFVEDVRVRARHVVTVDSLVARALSYSVTAPAVLGDRREAFEHAIADVLAPHATDGVIAEEVEAIASVFADAG